MSNTLRGLAAAVGLTFLTACSTTPTEPQPLTSPVEKSQTGLLGEKNPETGCYEKKKIDPNGVEKVTNIICPFIK